jgi:hypothetical protein
MRHFGADLFHFCVHQLRFSAVWVFIIQSAMGRYTLLHFVIQCYTQSYIFDKYEKNFALSRNCGHFGLFLYDNNVLLGHSMSSHHHKDRIVNLIIPFLHSFLRSGRIARSKIARSVWAGKNNHVFVVCV